ncbi:MAG: SDR family oxidoreductase [archaeon]|nr:SDR family oxidoreductase [archaeon]
MKLAKKDALITGGSSGIGKAIALRYIREGAKVIVFDVAKPDYEAEFYQVDVSCEEQIKKAFCRVKKLDVLINSAGIYFQAPVEETDNNALDRIVDVNLKGTYLMNKYALPLIKKSKGNIINISSGLGIVPEAGSPAYCSTKAAVIMLTKCMALRYAPDGVRVNAVLAGPIDTPLLRNAFSSEDEIKKYAGMNPMKRIGRPREVANVALFLASDEASYVTGGLYSVDGGESAYGFFS